MATSSATSRGALVGLEGTLFDGRFRLDERIAEGGFAVVFRAWQLALDRQVALKVLKAPKHQDEAGRAEFRERFAVEAKTIARLRHRHIVDVYDFAVATLPSGELAPWMALEWLEGETLARHLEQRRRDGQRGRAPIDALEFLRPVLEALTHAHSNGIAHRDIKPSNIMVTSSEAGASLRVLDFGIAKLMVDDQMPETGNTRTESAPVFSPAYAAPEQVAFSRTGPWTDVHALGLILSELMTDEPPFSDGDPDAHLFELVMARGRPTPASKSRDVGAFEPVLARALALAPRDRFRGAGELLAALEDAAEHPSNGDTAPATVLGNPPTPTRAPARRARVLALAGAAAVAAGAVVVATTRTPLPPEAISRIAAETQSVTSAAPTRTLLGADGTSRSPPAPSPPPAPSSTIATSPPPVALNAPAAAAKLRRKERKTAPTAPAPSPVSLGDGRDLFNDTK